MRRSFNRWVRSKYGQLAFGGLFLAVIVTMSVGQLVGWWQLSHLLGTARLDFDGPVPQVRRVSLSRLGVEGNSDSFAPSISADGRYIVFLSSADNLVSEDFNGLQDVFLYDRTTDEVRRISTAPDGAEANGRSQEAAISRDGRFVVFVSSADNLVPGDTNGVEDVFVYDWQTGVMSRVSVSSSGQEGNGMSVQPSLSADGRYVAFVSLADNLVEGDTNSVSDVFVHDRQTGQTALASISSEGQIGDGTSKYPALSANGRFVAFQSKSGNLAAGDTNQMYDIFVHDLVAGKTELVSRGVDGGVGNHESQRPSISDNGRYVAFESWADNLVPDDLNRYSDVFVADRETGVIELISVTADGEQATNVSGGAVISADGRFVAFASRADNLSPEDKNRQYDVYLHNRSTRALTLISRNLNGSAGNGSSISPALTTSGNYIVFDSLATDLVPDDHNERVDVFVFDAYVNVQFDHVVNLPLLVGEQQQRAPGPQLGSAGH